MRVLCAFRGETLPVKIAGGFGEITETRTGSPIMADIYLVWSISDLSLVTHRIRITRVDMSAVVEINTHLLAVSIVAVYAGIRHDKLGRAHSTMLGYRGPIGRRLVNLVARGASCCLFYKFLEPKT